MKVHAFRIVKERLAKDAFTGEGARIYGGRWNSSGRPVVYTASSASLAMLEMLVHLEARDLLRKYVLLEIEFDDSLVTDVDIPSLPRDWRSSPTSPEVQRFGDDWAMLNHSAVLRVPSVIVPRESNYLLNPRHPRYGEIKIGKHQPIDFDPRLK